MNFIQRWLGIDLLYDQSSELQLYITGIRTELKALNVLKTEIAVHNRALARMIAKLDPIFVVAEDSPARKADSERIAEEIIKKLRAEHIASNSHKGDQ